MLFELLPLPGAGEGSLLRLGKLSTEQQASG